MNAREFCAVELFKDLVRTEVRVGEEGEESYTVEQAAKDAVQMANVLASKL